MSNDQVVRDTSQAGVWHQAVQDRAAGRPVDCQGLLGAQGYTAAVDWPAAAFYKEVLAANPNVKVVLTVRDFDAWYDSVMKTIYRLAKIGRDLRPPFFAPRLGKGIRDVFAMHEDLIWNGIFAGRIEDREHARKVYESHLEEVRRCVPPEQLLEFDVRQGWQPLCAFLGKQVPQEPFPHVNEAAAFQQYVKKNTTLRRKMDVLRVAGNAVMAAALASAITLLLPRMCHGILRG